MIGNLYNQQPRGYNKLICGYNMNIPHKISKMFYAGLEIYWIGQTNCYSLGSIKSSLKESFA
jgi:predicted GNAT superfamily acetyltransferase